jgi:hypothetical protein
MSSSSSFTGPSRTRREICRRRQPGCRSLKLPTGNSALNFPFERRIQARPAHEKAKVRDSILNTIDSIEVRIVRNRVSCPHCGLPAAEYLTSDHTNESAILTVKNHQDGSSAPAGCPLLTSTFSRIRRRPSESQDDIDEALRHSGPRSAISKFSRATVCGDGFALT